MIIKTMEKGVSIERDKGLLCVEIEEGCRDGYSDVLHFYFPAECEVQYKRGHLILRRPHNQSMQATEDRA